MIPGKLLRGCDHPEFADIPSGYFDPGDAFHTHQGGPDLIEGDIPELDKTEGI